MSKRLSIDSIARMYSVIEADLSDGDPGTDGERCAVCGSLVPHQDGELLPPACPACGHEMEASDSLASDPKELLDRLDSKGRFLAIRFMEALADWQRSERRARGEESQPESRAKDKPAVADAVRRMRDAG